MSLTHDTIVRFRALNHIERSRKPRALSTELLDALAAGWHTDTEEEPETVEDLRACLATLSSYSRQLVQLRYGEGLSGAALADRLGRKLNTVYVALARILKRLGQCVALRRGSVAQRRGSPS